MTRVITNFVFFVAVSLVGMLISSVLGLADVKWIKPISRIAEIIAVSFAMVQMATYDPEHLIKFKATLENLVLGARNEKDEYTRTNCFEALSILTEYNIEAFQETKVVETLIDIKQNVATIRDRFRANRILHIFYANELGKKHLLLSIQSFLENDPDKIRVFLEENNWNDLIEFQA